MKCEEVRDDLVAYARGKLSAARRKAVEEHLVRCAGCARELEGARQVLALAKGADDASIADLAETILAAGIAGGASDIHLEPAAREGLVRLRVDGVLREHMTLPREHYEPLVARFKMLAGLSLEECRLPQDGRLPYTREGKDYDLRTATFPFVYGEGVIMRILDKSSVMIGMDKLGFTPDVLARNDSLLSHPAGIIILAGPEGSGRTTTLYSMLQKLVNPGRKILTIEDPVECQIPGFNQAQVNRKGGLTFANAIRSFMRADPDIILVGEVRDLEVAELCARAALTGHLVLTCMGARNAEQALFRLVEMGMEPFMVASSVIGIIGQRLVRKICPKCKEAFTPPAELLARLDMKPEAGAPLPTFYRGAGCEECNYAGGYKGRTGIQELLVMNDAIKDLIVRRAPLCEIRDTARASGMKLLREDGLQKALQGITTIEEVLRVVVEP